MSTRTYLVDRGPIVGCVALFGFLGLSATAIAQEKLPEVVVTAPKEKPKPPAKKALVTAPTAAPVTPAAQFNAKADAFDQSRSNIYTITGTTSDTLSYGIIDALPQGANATVEKILLQAPGVSQDSAASGLLHVRNDHANVQYRINGIMLPDGVTGFGSIFDA